MLDSATSIKFVTLDDSGLYYTKKYKYISLYHLMTTSVYKTLPSQQISSTTTQINGRVKNCLVSTYLERTDYNARKLNEELNCSRRALTFYNRENKTKILMLILVIIMVGLMCLVTVFFYGKRR